MMADADILLLPGLGGSGEGHWQSLWTRDADQCRIVAQADWDKPTKTDWLSALSAEIHALDGPFVLVAHSVGCALAAHWVSENLPTGVEANGPQLRAIMMVAPSDVDSSDHTPDLVRSFAPMPTLALPCASLVVASDDDPHVSIGRARFLAKSWNSVFVAIGGRGHINADSGLGSWPEGRQWLLSMIE